MGKPGRCSGLIVFLDFACFALRFMPARLSNGEKKAVSLHRQVLIVRCSYLSELN